MKHKREKLNKWFPAKRCFDGYGQKRKEKLRESKYTHISSIDAWTEKGNEGTGVERRSGCLAL